MNLDEVKLQIRLLGQSINEDNAQEIAADFIEICREVSAQFSAPGFQKEIVQFADVLTKEISECTVQNKKLEEEVAKNKTLLEKKEQIRQKYNDLEMLRLEIKMLQNKVLEISHLDERKMQDDIVALKAQNAEQLSFHIKSLNSLNAFLETAKEFLEVELRGHAAVAKANLEVIQGNLNETLEQLSVVPLKEKFAAFVGGYFDMVADYNRYAGKISEIQIDLHKINTDHESVLETFRSHQLDNEKIYGALKSREGVLNFVELLNKEIVERMNKYDEEIRIIVEKRDSLPVYQLAEAKEYTV